MYCLLFSADDGQHIFLHSLNIRTLRESWGVLAAAPLTITGHVLQRESFTVRAGVSVLIK